MPKWTRPKTWKDATVLPHFDANTYIADDLTWLFNKPAVRAHRGTELELPSANWTALLAPFERFDTGNLHTRSSADRLTIPEAGVYLIGGTARFETTASNAEKAIRFLFNGDYPIGAFGGITQSTDVVSLNGFAVFYFRAGDFVQMQMYQNYSTPIITTGSPPIAPEMWAVRLSDRTTAPSWTTERTWTANEIHTAALWNAQVRDNTQRLFSRPSVGLWSRDSQTHNGGGGANRKLTFESELWKSVSSMHDPNTNPGRITIPEAGVYLVGGLVEFDTNTTNFRLATITKNFGESVLASQGAIPGISTGKVRASVLTAHLFAANDYIELQGYQNSLGNLEMTSTFAYAPSFFAVQLAAT